MTERQMCRTCFCLGYDMVPINGEWSCMEHLNGSDAAAEIVRLGEQLAERTLQHKTQLDNAVAITARLAAAEARIQEMEADAARDAVSWFNTRTELKRDLTECRRLLREAVKNDTKICWMSMDWHERAAKAGGV